MQKELINTIKNKIGSKSWFERQEGVSMINELGIPVDEKQEDLLISILTTLAEDPKWEVRRLVASTLTNFRYIKVEGIIDKLIVDPNRWVKEVAERTRRKLKISESTDKRDRKYDYVLGLVRKLKRKYPEALNDEILDDILKSVLDVGEEYYEELASDATHQINTALTAIFYSTEEIQNIILKDDKYKGKIKEIFDKLLEQMEYLKRIVEDLRTYSEPYDSRDFTYEKIESILAEALIRAKQNTRLPESNINIKEIIEIEPKLILEAHKEGLINAFANIVCNAIEAMYGGGSLQISANSIKEEYIGVIISDTGIGMTKKQAEDARKRWTSKKQGVRRTGLGLPIAIKIIEKDHRGRVTIESKKGLETKVFIALPIHKEEELS